VSHADAMPSLKLVDMSWPGRLRAGGTSLAAIADGEPWHIKNAQGAKLGRIAKSWSPPRNRTFLRGEVGAVVRWRKADSKEEYRAHIRREEWEAVLPELVFD